MIARVGWPIIGGGLALSLLVSRCCGWWSWPCSVFTVFALQIFRDAAREIPHYPDAV
ncbi:phosphatidylserine decarboxylase, partial [Neisseria sp. P0017.S008]